MLQLTQAIQRCDLFNLNRPFTRCMAYNARIKSVSKQTVAAQPEPGTPACFEECRRCTGCGRIYWKGSHYQRLTERVAAALATEG